MNEHYIYALLDLFRKLEGFASTSIALFGPSIADEDSTCFTAFFQSQDELIDLIVSAIADRKGLSPDDLTDQTYDAVMEILYDQAFLAGKKESEDVYSEIMTAISWSKKPTYRMAEEEEDE